MRYKSSFLILFGFIFILILSSYIDLVYHEDAHKQIAISHGCTEYETRISLLEESYFKCNKYNTTKELYEQWKQLDSINEIVGYNVEVISFMIWGVGLIICLTIVSVKESIKGGKDGIQ